jgi:hypothetical protein
MKLNVIMDDRGAIMAVGEVLEEPERVGPFTVHVRLEPMPGHRSQLLEVSDDLRGTEAGHLFERLKAYLPRKS